MKALKACCSKQLIYTVFCGGRVDGLLVQTVNLGLKRVCIAFCLIPLSRQLGNISIVARFPTFMYSNLCLALLRQKLPNQVDALLLFCWFILNNSVACADLLINAFYDVV